MKLENPIITYSGLTKALSEKSGIGKSSIQKILSKYKNTKTLIAEHEKKKGTK